MNLDEKQLIKSKNWNRYRGIKPFFFQVCGIVIGGDLLSCPLLKRRYSVEETSKVENTEYANDLFHDSFLIAT